VYLLIKAGAALTGNHLGELKAKGPRLQAVQKRFKAMEVELKEF